MKEEDTSVRPRATLAQQSYVGEFAWSIPMDNIMKCLQMFTIISYLSLSDVLNKTVFINQDILKLSTIQIIKWLNEKTKQKH